MKNVHVIVCVDDAYPRNEYCGSFETFEEAKVYIANTLECEVSELDEFEVRENSWEDGNGDVYEIIGQHK